MWSKIKLLSFSYEEIFKGKQVHTKEIAIADCNGTCITAN